MMQEILASPWTALAARTFAITVVGRIVLDIATPRAARGARASSFWSAVAGWSLALLLAAWLLGGGLGTLAAAVAVVIHVATILGAREADR